MGVSRPFLIIAAALAGGSCGSTDQGPHTLTITSHYTGIVVSDPAGIDCGMCIMPPAGGGPVCTDTVAHTACTAAFPYGTMVHVTLTQSGATSYICVAQPDGLTGCTITMDSDQTMTVNGEAALL